jgi:hypothetical protein
MTLAPSPRSPKYAISSPVKEQISPASHPQPEFSLSTAYSNGKGAHLEPPHSFSTPDNSVENAARSLQQFSTPRTAFEEKTKSLLSANTSQSGHDEEAVVYSQTRMLQDGSGRLRKATYVPLTGNCLTIYSISRGLGYPGLPADHTDDGGDRSRPLPFYG